MKKLKKNLQNLLKKERSLVDIFIFGSALKSKENPKDIDLVSFFRMKDYRVIEEVNYKIKKEGDRHKLNVHIEPLIVDDMLHSEVYRNIIHEGFSIRYMQPVKQILNFGSFLLVTYHLKNKKPSEKVMFSYALFGRKKGGGILNEMGGKGLGKGSILVPVDREDIILSFFNQWNVAFKRQRVLLFS